MKHLVHLWCLATRITAKSLCAISINRSNCIYLARGGKIKPFTFSLPALADPQSDSGSRRRRGSHRGSRVSDQSKTVMNSAHNEEYRFHLSGVYMSGSSTIGWSAKHPQPPAPPHPTNHPTTHPHPAPLPGENWMLQHCKNFLPLHLFASLHLTKQSHPSRRLTTPSNIYLLLAFGCDFIRNWIITAKRWGKELWLSPPPPPLQSNVQAHTSQQWQRRQQLQAFLGEGHHIIDLVVADGKVGVFFSLWLTTLFEHLFFFRLPSPICSDGLSGGEDDFYKRTTPQHVFTSVATAHCSV